MTTQRDDRETQDRELVRRAKAGDSGAFEEIWQLYWTPVYVAAMSVLHHDRDAAGDAAAEVFASVVAGGLRKFDESRPLLPFLRTIATRRAIEAVRRRSKNVSVSYTAEVPDVATTDLVSDGVVSQEHGLALFWALANLLTVDDERRLFPLWVLETTGRMTREEVAAELGWTVGATATRVHRLRKSLKYAGTAISLVHHGDRTCGGFRALVPDTEPPPSDWRKLVTHVRSCAECGPKGERLFRADRMLPTIAAAVIAAAEAARPDPEARSAAALTPLAPAEAIDLPAFDDPAPIIVEPPVVFTETVSPPAPVDLGSAIGKKLAVAGTIGTAVITGLLLLTPGVVLRPVTPPGALQTLPPAPPGPSDSQAASTLWLPPPSTSTTGVPRVTSPGAPIGGVTGGPTGGRPTAATPGPGVPGPQAGSTWAHWQVRWASEPGTRQLGPLPQHPGNEESNWTAGDWTPGRKATVTRTGAGRYTVVLPEVGRPGGFVHITANDLGATGSTCQPVRWWQQGADEAVEVGCFARSGAPADSPFTGLFTVGTHRVPVIKTGVGTYQVAQAAVHQLTPVGSALRHCSGAGQVVRCTDSAGIPADTEVVATGASTTTLVPGHPHGADLRFTTAVEHQWLSRPGNATVERTGTGRYTVRVPVGWLPSYTHVSAIGPGYCTLVSRNDIGENNTVLAVACFTPAGAAADGGFHLSYTTTSVYVK
ncbi:hypothetical protein DL990_13455 [Amycolatopsis sp. WAC 01416]|uniref:RNA polymerase sigma factor n=1 Tax=Amycolatopsis sp. WAC 01416 TaxID=2203196 RepID=UPI000F7723C9|nr:sigma-70 family RNA polymerase sigma factor [Amycolatopsis sp. WAC 01416]RSN34641.1 hypothetical protein DL990_13455 [Amycolatopsis sp. WAC 01416]